MIWSIICIKKRTQFCEFARDGRIQNKNKNKMKHKELKSDDQDNVTNLKNWRT